MMMTRSVTVSMSASCGQIAGQIAFDPDYLAHDLRDDGSGRSDRLIRVTMLSHARFSFLGYLISTQCRLPPLKEEKLHRMYMINSSRRVDIAKKFWVTRS